MATAQKPKKKSKVNPANTEMEELVPSSTDLNELFETGSSTTGTKYFVKENSLFLFTGIILLIYYIISTCCINFCFSYTVSRII